MATNLSHHPLISSGLLWRAIAISLLLHAVLLLQPGFDTEVASPASPQSLIAMLRVRGESQFPQAPTLPAPALPEHKSKRLDANKLPAPELVQEIPSTTPAVSMLQATKATPEAVSPSTMESSSVNSSTHNAIDASTATAAITAGAGLDFAEGKKAYMFALAAEARRVKKYPARALTAGRTGALVIRIEVAAGGTVQAPQLQQSSGFDDIDNAALSFVGIALKRTPLPDNLRGRAFAFDLPVSFTLKDN
jgi:protein TonB